MPRPSSLVGSNEYDISYFVSLKWGVGGGGRREKDDREKGEREKGRGGEERDQLSAPFLSALSLSLFSLSSLISAFPPHFLFLRKTYINYFTSLVAALINPLMILIGCTPLLSSPFACDNLLNVK